MLSSVCFISKTYKKGFEKSLYETFDFFYNENYEKDYKQVKLFASRNVKRTSLGRKQDLHWQSLAEPFYLKID